MTQPKFSGRIHDVANRTRGDEKQPVYLVVDPSSDMLSGIADGSDNRLSAVCQAAEDFARDSTWSQGWDQVKSCCNCLFRSNEFHSLSYYHNNLSRWLDFSQKLKVKKNSKWICPRFESIHMSKLAQGFS